MARIHITDKAIRDHIKTASGISYLRDDECRGFFVRHNSKNGVARFYVQSDQPMFDHLGERVGKRMITLMVADALNGTKAADARREAVKGKSLITSGKDFIWQGKHHLAVNPNQPSRTQGKTISLTAAMREYLNFNPPKNDKRRREFEREMELQFGKLLSRPVHFFSPQFIAKNYQPTHVTHKAYMHLSGILRFCNEDREPRIKIDPDVFIRIRSQGKQYNKNVKRTKPLTIKTHHVPVIWAEMDRMTPHDPWCDLSRFILYTGMRKGEAAAMEWRRVDFKDRSFWIPDSKNGEPLHLAMSDQVFDLLQSRVGKHKTFVFGADKYRNGHPASADGSKTYRRFNAAIRKELDDEFVAASPHQLRKLVRHTLASTLHYGETLIDSIMNHSPKGVGASSYGNRFDVEPKRDPMQRLADRIDELIKS